jgi:hypothetical protein
MEAWSLRRQQGSSRIKRKDAILLNFFDRPAFFFVYVYRGQRTMPQPATWRTAAGAANGVLGKPDLAALAFLV